jgi:hypothetical protein
VLKTPSPGGSAISGGGGNYRRWDLARRSKSMGHFIWPFKGISGPQHLPPSCSTS